MPQNAALLYEHGDPDWSVPATPAAAATMADYATFSTAAAVIRGGAALHPRSRATVVQVPTGRGGAVVTTPGPAAEAKETLTGFYLLECADLDEAIRSAAP